MSRLRIEQCTAGYAERPVFREVSATVEPGEWVHVSGRNGAGKTTLLHVVTSFLKPLGGDILWNGTSVFQNPAGHRRRLRFVADQRGLYHRLSVEENWNLFEALFGISGIASGPLAADLSPGQTVQHLSRGQAKRVELATLFPDSRPLVVVDEPMASLDRDSRSRLSDWFQSICRHGRMVITASPRPLDAADRGWELRDGRLHIAS